MLINVYWGLASLSTPKTERVLFVVFDTDTTRFLTALQVLLHCCRCCPSLCEAATAVGLPDVLLQSACSTASNTAALSLLVLTAVIHGVVARVRVCTIETEQGKQQQQLAAAVQALRPSQATDAVIVKLAGKLGRLIAAASSAIAEASSVTKSYVAGFSTRTIADFMCCFACSSATPQCNRCANTFCSCSSHQRISTAVPTCQQLQHQPKQ